MTPEERDALFEKMDLDNQLAKLETQFRNILLKERVYTEISLPTRRTTEKEDDVACSADKPKEKQEKAKGQNGHVEQKNWRWILGKYSIKKEKAIGKTGMSEG